MRTRLLILISLTALALAPLSGLACALECSGAGHAARAADPSAHAGCHQPSDTSSIFLGHVPHDCDHLVAIPRTAGRVSAQLGNGSTGTTFVATPVDAFRLVVNRALVSASPPRSFPFHVSSISTPLLI